MKITIFISTEFRPPKKGEWFIGQYGDFIKSAFDYANFRLIVEKHEIEVPEGANQLTVQLRGSCNTPPAVHIQLPKKKVKKWKWWRKIGDVEIETTQHHTFEEMSRNNLVGEFWQKVEGSEIE
jgi:hypothetical protein